MQHQPPAAARSLVVILPLILWAANFGVAMVPGWATEPIAPAFVSHGTFFSTETHQPAALDPQVFVFGKSEMTKTSSHCCSRPIHFRQIGPVMNKHQATEPVAFQRYPALAAPSIVRGGGRILARSERSEALEGSPSTRVILLEFPDKATAMR